MVQLLTLTPWQKHVRQWKDCAACPLASTRARICLARGDIPAEVLFIGEAPGASENSSGLPFVGPAGKVMDYIIQEAVTLSRPFRYCITNVVCCFPKDLETGQGRQPVKEEIKACAPRLKDLVWTVRPRLIVLVGDVAKKAGLCQAALSNDKVDYTLPWMPANQFLRFEEIIHPAAIIRTNAVSQNTLVQRAVVTIASAVDELSEGK